MQDNEANKIQKEINATKEILVKYGFESLKDYMRQQCHRSNLFELGDEVITPSGYDGVVIGWNGSCNYDVFVIEKDTIVNVHPNDLKYKQGV